MVRTAMVRFIYSGGVYDTDREKVVENLTKCVALIVPLPKNIEIEFKRLSDSIYGETILDPRFPNRIRLSETLTTKEILRPLVHELLHLNQTFTGELSMQRDGSYVWQGKVFRVNTKGMTVGEWEKLPWEQDVANTQDAVFFRAMKSFLVNYSGLDASCRQTQTVL